MNTTNRKHLWIAIVLLASFVLWTVAVCTVDVKPIGPHHSTVGFASLNQWFHSLTGVRFPLYTLTDWLGLIPLVCVMGFGILGLTQWVRRKRLAAVDRSLLILGGFYLIVMAVYILFEMVVINHRPVLISGYSETSYPSSTTLLVLCVIPTAAMQLRSRIQQKRIRQWVTLSLITFAVFMVLGRLASGVHWLTDIVGGILLSAGLVALYRYVCDRLH